MENLRYWLGLNMINGVGPITIKHLISVFGSPKLVFSANEDELLNIANITKSKAEAIVNFKEWEHVDREIERSERGEFSIITMEHENYPLGLRQIDDPPPVLYVKGELRDSDRFSISIVGSRRCTGYGVSVAEMMSKKLSSYGLTIVSGMAKGIDSIAHRAALSAGGRSIGVLGCGIDIIYPKLNGDLFRSIPASGAILTEFPTGTRPYKENFPRRNRLISGLSLGVLVVEASERSGSLSTANHALNQGKEVFSIPGNINRPNSKGTNNLIKNGARLIDDPEEIIAELAPLLKGFLDEKREDVTFGALSDEEKMVLDVLNSEPKHIDLIIRESGFSSHRVISILLELELKGVVRQWHGKRFSII